LTRPPLNIPRTCVFTVVVALALRLGVVGFLYPEHLNPDRAFWRFAGEAGKIAHSLVEGRGFSSPFFADTGPTALMPPIYPYLIAVVFKLFGTYTKSSALAMLSLDSLFSALTCLPIFFIARKCFGDRTGVVAAWTWAFFPYAIYFSADFIWPTVLTTLLLSLLFLMVLHLAISSRRSLWLGFGLLSGLAILTEPIVLSVLPLLGGWACYRLYRKNQRWFPSAAVAALALAAFVSPWFIRNYHTFHKPILFRDNFGLELYVGNNGVSWHWASPGIHPSASETEWQEFVSLGELGYMARKQHQAAEFINSHRVWFIGMSLRRAVYFWTNFWSLDRRYLAEEPFDPFNIFFSTALTVLAFAGLWRAYRRRLTVAVPYAIVLFFFPVTYYITHMQDYYRRPIDPFFVILAVYGLTGRGRLPAQPVGIRQDYS
jgi:4-amino-4-deoxy-L-arabinose transferase-like glycosyltransferase